VGSKVDVDELEVHGRQSHDETHRLMVAYSADVPLLA